MKRSPEKHIPYFDLLESLREARLCVLCEMRDRTTHRYLENILYESVNDTDLRARLIESRGFCPAHAGMLLRFGDALGTSILYRDQVEAVLRSLGSLKKQQGKTSPGKARFGREPHAPCPVCKQETEMDTLRIKTLLESLPESEMSQAFEESPGLCLPHLLITLEKTRKAEIRNLLLELHRGKFSQLLEELKEFIRKQDYRNADEKYGREADAWKRAPWMILGGR